MLKRYNPTTQPDSTITSWDLPDTFVGGTVTIFINGQMLALQDDDSEVYGYTVDEDNKTLDFYNAPLDGDFLYIIYDSDGSTDAASDYSGTGLMRLNKGFNLISYQGQKEALWDKDKSQIDYKEGILANVQNLFIDQIEDVYGVSANTIVREIQTYETDSGKYRTFNVGNTSPAWCGNAEHITDSSLYREALTDGTEYGDPGDNDYVVYNPNNFTLSNCYIDTDTITSLDIDNKLEDLPAGLRTGILIYIYPDADLSKTDDLLEIWF